MDKLKLAALGERLKIGGERLKTGGAEMGRKVSGKMKEILQGQPQEAKMVDEATSDSLAEPNWGLNLRICALLNGDELNGPEVMRAIKKKISSKNTVSQRLTLDLLEACAMNCDKVFSEVASEKVLDEMVRMIENSQTHHSNRHRALQLIQAWGESDDLAYLPVFHQTYMSLKARNIPSQMESNDDGVPMFSSLEPGFDEPLVLPEGYPNANMDHLNGDPNDFANNGGVLSIEEKKEILTVSQNSIEILSSILNSKTQPEESIKDDLTLSMLDKCKDSQPYIQRIIETAGDDEELLFEALNLHEELQHVLSKYAEIEAADIEAATPPCEGRNLDTSSTSDSSRPVSVALEEKENVEQSIPTPHSSEAVNDNKNVEGEEQVNAV